MALVHNGQTYAIEADHFNTPRRISNAQNQTVWQWAYSGFGEEEPHTTTEAPKNFHFNLRYPGQIFDAESGLFYNWHRSYDPQTGRYTQPDPIELAGGWNRFTYVQNNPINYYDPYGLWVSGTYNNTSGTLVLHDLEKRKTITGKYESGGKPFGDPIPPGQYDILLRAGRKGFFRLEPLDSSYGDDIDQMTGRKHFRLHRPGRTIGCISAVDSENWSDVEEFINSTKSDKVKVRSMSRWPWAPKTETLPRYGRITVIH